MHTGHDKERTQNGQQCNPKEARHAIKPDHTICQPVADDFAQWCKGAECKRDHNQQGASGHCDRFNKVGYPFAEEPFHIAHHEHGQDRANKIALIAGGIDR